MGLLSMQRLTRSLCLLACLSVSLSLALAIPPGGHAAGPDSPHTRPLPVPTPLAEPGIRPGEILVKFDPGVSSLDIESANRRLETSVIEVIPKINLYRLRLAEGTTIAEATEYYEHTTGVAYAEPNHIVRALETVPDDPGLPEQWGLDRIQAPAAWDIVTGTSDILVAIIDTGIDYTHPDLDDGRYAGGYDFVNDDNDPMDDEGHGTHVAGIATANTDNGVGVAGLAWNSQFMGVKVLDAQGVGSDFDLAEGIRYAADHGAHVANMSLGSPFTSRSVEEAMQYAHSKGVVMACAAGNSGSSGVHYPAAHDPYCLAVAASDRNDERAGFSSYGPEVDVAAPGVDILSTTGGSYQSWSGTSMATPHVAGLAALILSRDPGLSVDQVFAAIRDSADDVNAETHPGEDDYLGTGRINAYHALASLIKIAPANTTVRIGSPFTVTASIMNVADLGSFQFDLTYVSRTVTATNVVCGPFLGSTGRTVGCSEAAIDNAAGSVTFGCSSEGNEPGPDGAGMLAALSFNAVDYGSSHLQFENALMMDTNDVTITVATQDGSVTVTAGCREDVNGDGVINVVDIQLVAAHWNTAAGDPDYDALYDINADSRINIVDIQLVASKWGTTC